MKDTIKPVDIREKLQPIKTYQIQSLGRNKIRSNILRVIQIIEQEIETTGGTTKLELSEIPSHSYLYSRYSESPIKQNALWYTIDIKVIANSLYMILPAGKFKLQILLIE